MLTKLGFVVMAIAAGGCGAGAGAGAHGVKTVKTYDVLIKGGTIHDGSGGEPTVGDVAIDGDVIAAVGKLAGARGRVEIDARGLVVAPGFINMLSWAIDDIMHDGRALADVRQGVTLEVFGEGVSMGPLSPAMKARFRAEQEEIQYDIAWTTLDEYLRHVEARGVSTNVASFVGATTIREHVLGEDDVDPTPAQLAEMARLVDEAMRDGALGVGSSLIYAPAAYAETAELEALCRVVARHGGMYISHVRDEGDRLVESVDELIGLARRTGVRAELYHLKASGRRNWGKIDEVVRRVEAARAEGLAITANMYTYTASFTGLSSVVDNWAHAGGREALLGRLRDPEMRRRIIAEIEGRPNNVSEGAGEHVLLVRFRNAEHRGLQGKRLSEIARARGRSAAETVVDLLIENEGSVGAVFFSMSEDNVRRQLQLPWVSFGSDAGAMAPEGVFLTQSTHPRAYGNFARLLGHYVRDEKLISVGEAIRKLTSLPAENLRIERRGALRPGFHGDVVVLDLAKVKDVATYERPHQLAEGVVHVLVNGVPVLRDGEHTGAKPGRVVRGPGWGR